MTLQEKLQTDLKKAMRDRDETRKSVIRFVRAAIHDKEIETQSPLDDEGIITVLVRQAQQRLDSIEAFEQADRQDLVEKEKSELTIIQQYLPEQMPESDIRDLVQDAIENTSASGPQDIGKVMQQVMPQIKGKAPGKIVSQIAQELLRS